MITIDRLSLPGDWRPKPGDLLRIKSISGNAKNGRWTFKMELVTDDNRRRLESKVQGLKEMADSINEAYEKHKNEDPYEFAKAVMAMAIEKLKGAQAELDAAKD